LSQVNIHLSRKVRQVCDWWFAPRAMYFPPLVSPTAMPSLSSWPWIRGAQQSGFLAGLILRITSFTSAGTVGCSLWRSRRTFQVQNSRRPLRCQPINGLRLDNDQRGAPVSPDLGKVRHRKPVSGDQLRTLYRVPQQHGELMREYE